MNRSFIDRLRITLLTVFVAAGFLGVGANLCRLHIFKRSYCVKAIEETRNRTIKIDARRGDILDSRGNILATTAPYIELGCDPVSITEKDEQKFGKLAEILGTTTAQIRELCKKTTYKTQDGAVRQKRWRKMADQLDEGTYSRIKDLNFKGIYGVRKYKRMYPAGALTSHIIGFVNAEAVPEFGVEKMSDYYLRGQDGWKEIEFDGRRREMAQFRGREQDAVDGMNVETSIDIILQEAAHQEMRKIVSNFNPDGASIIISDTSGFILSMVNYPNFDPNSYNKFPMANLRNRAISDRLEPGSTFKIVPVSAALNEAFVSADDVFDCKNSTATYKNRILKLPKDTHVYEKLSVRDIIKKSSNRGSAQIGILIGENKLYEYAKEFGYGEKTGIGLAGEVSGILHKVKDWDGLTITRLPMGHAIDATPLQIHCAMSVIANGGLYMKPQVIKKVSSKSDGASIVFSPKAMRRVVSPKTAALMSDMLVGVTEKGGTATRAAVDGFKVAGKTGTAQKIVNGRYVSTQHVASFTGFFPAQRPRLVITVIIDNPRGKPGSGYGGVSAAPAFSSLAKTAASYLGIQNDEEAAKGVAWKFSK